MAVSDTPMNVLQDFNLDASVPDVQPISTQITPPVKTGGLSLNDLAPSNLNADQNTVVPETPSFLAAMGAGMFSTAMDWYGGYKEDFVFEKDPTYDATNDADEWFKTNDRRSADETEYLNTATSADEFQYRTQRLLDKRMRNDTIAQRPVAGMIGSIADVDLVTGFIPIIGQGKWAARVGTAVGAGGTAAAINAGNEGSVRSDAEQMVDPLIFGVGALFSTVRLGKVPEVAQIQAEQATKASTQGSLGTAEIMGVPLEIPISAAPKVDRQIMPDWYHNSVGKWIESSADTLYRLTGKNDTDPVNKLLASPRTQGDNATYHAAAVQNELESMLVRFEDNLDTATTRMFGTRSWNPLQRADHIANQQTVMRQFQEGMQSVDAVVTQRMRDGIAVTPDDIDVLIKEYTQDPHLQKVMSDYTRSGFAETAYDHMKRVGLLSEDLASDLPRRSTYTPLRHSYDRINALLKSGIDPDTLYNFIGKQIMRMHPTLANKEFSLTEKQLGQNFVSNQERAALGLTDLTSTGISSDGMRELLKGTNLTGQQVENVINKLVPKSDKDGSNAMTSLRQRISWDWTDQAIDPLTGRTIKMSDIVDADIALTLNDYARSLSKRVGLAQYGIKTPAALDRLLENVVSSRPADVSLEAASNFAKNVRASLLGLPVGEALPPALRSLNTVGGSMVLSNSGIWGIMDLATQTMRLGLIRTLPELAKGIKHAVTPLKGLSKSEANSLYDVLTQRVSTEGRWRNFTMRYNDNFEVSKGIHDRIAYYGQGTRFTNLSESVKRMQVGLMGGVIASAFDGAAKGVKSDVKFLKSGLKMSDELVDEITKQYQKHGDVIDNWDGNVRIKMEQKVFFEMDNNAFTIHTGELPAFLEHSAVGKVIFPFLSFTMAMQQKVLQHTVTRDGTAGLLSLMAVQFPMAVLLGMAKNIKDGKEPDEKLASTSMTALSMLGIWSVPLGAIDQGGIRGGATAFTPFNKGLSLTSKLFSEDSEVSARDVKNATPFVGAMTALDLFISAVSEEGDK